LQSRKLACSVISTATAGDICFALRVPGLSRQKSMDYQNRSIPFTVKTAKKLKLREPYVITVRGKAFYDMGHAPADHSNRRNKPEGYAVWEISSVMKLDVQ
jgi:hypothetical protein